MLDTKSKFDEQETSDSFYPQKIDVGIYNSQNIEIIRLNSQLTEKKHQLRRLKLMNLQLKGKKDQQQTRIQQIKINFEFLKNKAQQIVDWKQVNQKRENQLKLEIKELNIKLNNLKDSTIQQYQQAIKVKKNNQKLININKSIEANLREVNYKSDEVQEQIFELDNIVNLNQNQFRNIQQSHSKLVIESHQYEAQINKYDQKCRFMNKQNSSHQFKGHQISLQLASIQMKIPALKEELNQVQLESERILYKNTQAQVNNNKLRRDLDAIKQHLENIKKTNKMLIQNLKDYSKTAMQVSILMKEEQFK